MRELTVKQKRLLLTWANENPDLMQKYTDLVNKMPHELWEKIEAINDTEILYQNVNSYLDELDWVWTTVKGNRVLSFKEEV